MCKWCYPSRPVRVYQEPVVMVQPKPCISPPKPCALPPKCPTTTPCPTTTQWRSVNFTETEGPKTTMSAGRRRSSMVFDKTVETRSLNIRETSPERVGVYAHERRISTQTETPGYEFMGTFFPGRQSVTSNVEKVEKATSVSNARFWNGKSVSRRSMPVNDRRHSEISTKSVVTDIHGVPTEEIRRSVYSASFIPLKDSDYIERKYTRSTKPGYVSEYKEERRESKVAEPALNNFADRRQTLTSQISRNYADDDNKEEGFRRPNVVYEKKERKSFTQTDGNKESMHTVDSTATTEYDPRFRNYRPTVVYKTFAKNEKIEDPINTTVTRRSVVEETIVPVHQERRRKPVETQTFDSKCLLAPKKNFERTDYFSDTRQTADCQKGQCNLTLPR